MTKKERKEYYHNWYLKNKEKHKEHQKEYYARPEVKEHYKKYFKLHKEKLLEQMREYRETHKEERKEYLTLHKIELSDYNKEYYQKNKKYFSKLEIKEQQKEYMKNRRKIDINFKLGCNLRKRIWDALKGNNKSTRTMKLLGCSLDFFKEYFEKQFTKGMNWENYGSGWNGKGMKQWHVDHIKPCASFDLTKPSEQHKCFHFSNLQPLWAKENLEKSDKF